MDSNGRILMIYGTTRYNAMNNYLDELGKVYISMGYVVDYVDGRRSGYADELYQYTYDHEYKVIFTCNEILTDYTALVRKDSIICCLMFDHPMHHFDILEKADENVVVINCDAFSAEYIARYCANVGSVAYVPLSGSYIEDRIPYSDRKYDVVFTGSNMSSHSAYEDMVSTLGDDTIKLADNIIDIMKNNPDITIQEAFGDVIRREGLVMTDRFFYVKMSRLYQVDNYMRAWIREQVIRKITDSGIKINVYGEGWEDFECSYPENIIRMAGDAKEALKAVANSRIALNVMPWFRGGFQERIASAMLCGTVALTDSSTYIEDNFTDGEDIVIYDRNKLERLPDIIKELLNNPQKAERIAQAGYDKAVSGHTWRHRAVEIMDVIDESIEWLEQTRSRLQGTGQEKIRPKVSVVVPVYNAEKTLKDCLGNLVNQTIDSIEIIIVDDCSSDNSRKIISDCEQQYYDRVKVLYQEKNTGPGGARNTGVTAASGEYIGFVDSDDIVDVTLFEKLYNKAVDGDYDIVDSGYYNEELEEAIIYTPDECTGKLDSKKRSMLIAGGGGYIFSKLFRAELLGDCERVFREKCILEDNDFIFHMFMKAESVGTVKEILYLHKYYDNSASHNIGFEKYQASISNAMIAIYDRLKSLDGYDDVKEAVEAHIYRLYSWAVNYCIKKECNNIIKPEDERIKELYMLKNSITSVRYDDNKYIRDNLPELDRNIMKRIEDYYE